jgi:NAD-dependent dihydropyrimidine dehydrogenase PreA subunit
MRRGYCDYSCNACGRVCPTGAIAALSLAKKRVETIGVAVINEATCIPFKEDRECIVCEEMCPLPEKAIILETEAGHEADRPHVRAELCTGCGICEKQCPLNGEAAIRVYPPGTVVAESGRV